MNEDTTQQGVSSADDSQLATALGADAPQGEQTQQQAAEPDAGAEQSQADGGEGDGSEASIETYEQLAEALGVKPEELGTIKVKTKVDGEEKDATLAELIKSYQLEGHVNRKSIELSEKQKAWETEQVKTRDEWTQRIAFAGQVLDSQEAQLAQQYNSINWAALQQQDPAQYSALYLQFQQAAQQLSGQKQALAQHFQQTQAQMREVIRPKALETIRSQHPDLADPVSYGNALAEMKGYLKGIGGNESQFDVLEMDPVVFRAIRDAARYSKLAAQRPDVNNKVANAPKFEKASARPVGNERQKAIRDRAMKGDEDAMAALLAT